MSKPIPPAVFALKAWRIKKQGDKFFISPTAVFGDKGKWSKPYATLQHATTAIARKLAAEWTDRHNRCRQSHGLRQGQ